jgi:hypothetical protein
MRTAKRRNVKNRTIKGGLQMPNTKVHLIVRKSKIDPLKLIYDLVIARPAFPFITDYVHFNMNAVDEAIAFMRMEEVPVKNELGNVDKPEPNVLYKDEFEFGYNEIENDDKTVNIKQTKEEEEEAISKLYADNMAKIKEDEKKKNKQEKKDSTKGTSQALQAALDDAKKRVTQNIANTTRLKFKH